MQIAFYAPMKPPTHPVPSGERLMARLLIEALRRGGHAVETVSTLRSFAKDPAPDGLTLIRTEAAIAQQRIAERWRAGGRPDLWMCYHPYYKAPDLLGPDLTAAFAIPYVTVESSYAPRRDADGWATRQALVLTGLHRAAMNICLTARDRAGLLAAVPQARVARLAPFIDTGPFAAPPEGPRDPTRLIAVAMMRAGDKWNSHAFLAQALALLPDRPWRLSMVGDGPMRGAVEAAFAPVAHRVDWHGQLPTDRIAALLRQSALFVWPGCGEAYGLAYLEAQASGLPVVAQRTAGVPEVVEDGRTGLLTPPGDAPAYAEAIVALLSDASRRAEMSATARAFVVEQRSLDGAAARLDAILTPLHRGAK